MSAAVPEAPDAPVAPPAAAVVFGDRLPVLQAYADLLATAGVERGLLGPREAPRLWERHLLNCAGLADLLAPGLTVADLGAGAGLPGLVLAAARPDLHVVLVEPLLRRADFLNEAVALLGLEQVSVCRARAEDLVGASGFPVDVVVARAVAPLDRLAGWALPLLRPGGRLLALKGERAEAEAADAKVAITRAGGSGAQVVSVGVDHLSTWARVVVIERDARPGGSSAATKKRSTRTAATTTGSARRARGAGPRPTSGSRPDPGTSGAGPAVGSTAGSSDGRRATGPASTPAPTSAPMPSTSSSSPPFPPPNSTPAWPSARASRAPRSPTSPTRSARSAT